MVIISLLTIATASILALFNIELGQIFYASYCVFLGLTSASAMLKCEGE